MVLICVITVIAVITYICLTTVQEESLPKEFKNFPQLANRIEGTLSEKEKNNYWYFRR